MKRSFILLSFLLSLQPPSASAADLSDWEGKYFQRGLTCSWQDPIFYSGFDRLETRDQVVQAAAKSNFLGYIIPNPICTLLNRDTNQKLKDYFSAISYKCENSKNRSCQLIPLTQKYLELQAQAHQGPKDSQIELSKDWGQIDFHSGNWNAPLDFRTWQTNGSNKALLFASQMLRVEVGLNERIKDAMIWSQPSVRQPMAADSIAGQAIASIYGNSIGAATRALFEVWICPTRETIGTQLNSCGIRKDILYLTLQDSLGNLTSDAEEVVERIGKIEQALFSNIGLDMLKIHGHKNASLDRFINIVQLSQQIEKLRQKFRETGDMGTLVESEESEQLDKILAVPMLKNYVGELNTEEGAVDVQSFRSLSEILDFIAILRDLKAYQLADSEISRRQYAIWENSYPLQRLKTDLHDYLRRQINQLDKYLEEEMR